MHMNYARQYPRFWLTYFVASVILVAVNFGGAFFDALAGRGSIQSAVSQVIGVLGLLPLFGFVRQRRLNPRLLWRGVFVIAGFGQIAASCILIYMLFKTGSGIVLASLLGLTLFGGPFLFAIFQYIHRSPHIWKEQAAGTGL